jgi:1-acyl-sn-glycerol-3-phosphate acyltransferase
MGGRRLIDTTASPLASRRAQVSDLKAYSDSRNAVPDVSPWLLRWFLSYAPRYTRAHFNNLRVSGAEQFAGLGERPAIIYLNHPGWWDPMIAAVLARRYFPGRTHYTPMDATALDKYKFLSRLGFFGVEQNSLAGARRFLDIGRQIANRPGTVLWITAQGRFSDVRERPLKLAPGLAHLLKNSPDVIVFPMAVEFPYAEERKPEALVRFGLCLASAHASTKNMTAVLERELTHTMDELANSAIHRDYRGFETILSGKSGVGGVYDVWRSLKTRLRGQKFDAAHGSK